MAISKIVNPMWLGSSVYFPKCVLRDEVRLYRSSRMSLYPSHVQRLHSLGLDSVRKNTAEDFSLHYKVPSYVVPILACGPCRIFQPIERRKMFDLFRHRFSNDVLVVCPRALCTCFAAIAYVPPDIRNVGLSSKFSFLEQRTNCQICICSPRRKGFSLLVHNFGESWVPLMRLRTPSFFACRM